MSDQFTSLCYHYIRKIDDPFPRILGNPIDEFEKHLKMIKSNFSISTPDDILNFYSNNISLEKPNNILFTFDDGLSDHFEAAKILYENDIQAIFFVPTCIVDEKLPANPMIIHYCIAEFGIKQFLDTYHEILRNLELSNPNSYFISYEKNKDDVWDTINRIKTMFKYTLESVLGRNILLKIFNNLFLSKYPNGLDLIHLNESKIKKMIDMGHTIGTHTHTHISVAASKLNQQDFEKEIIYPKKFLSEKFNIDVFSFSYPFGEKQDCLSSSELLTKTNSYELAFTVNPILNTKKSSPLQIGRYSPSSKDSTEILMEKINHIFSN